MPSKRQEHLKRRKQRRRRATLSTAWGLLCWRPGGSGKRAERGEGVWSLQSVSTMAPRKGMEGA